MKLLHLIGIGLLCWKMAPTYAQNISIDSFGQAKLLAKTQIYFDHLETFYCRAKIDSNFHVVLPDGFTTPKYQNRSRQVEWEHVVPAENFGRAFESWRNGNSRCIDGKGQAYKGRHCAEKVSPEYRWMQADLYNLYPAIGAVNATRSNFKFTQLPEMKSAFGSCPMKVTDKQVEPPDYTKGTIARTYLYMQDAYPEYFHMNPNMEKMMLIWDEKFPPDEWECERARRIYKIQGNENRFVMKKC